MSVFALGPYHPSARRVYEPAALPERADHVCLQVLTADPATLPLREWERLATALR
jgi:hypothetical protein